jgi:hypothetical protein
MPSINPDRVMLTNCCTAVPSWTEGRASQKPR